MFSYGLSWQASLVTVWRVGGCSGSARRGKAGEVSFGMVSRGEARYGRRGRARLGEARYGVVRHGRRGRVWFVMAWQARRVMVRLGTARHGRTWQARIFIKRGDYQWFLMRMRWF